MAMSTATPEKVKNDDDESVYSVVFWDGTTTVTANTTNKTSGDSTVTNLAKNTIITFTYDGSDIKISAVNKLTAGSTGVAAIGAYSNSKAKFATTADTADIDNDLADEDVMTSSLSALFDIDDDTVIMYIDKENAKGVDGGSIQLATKYTDEHSVNFYIANCFYVEAGGDVSLWLSMFRTTFWTCNKH